MTRTKVRHSAAATTRSKESATAGATPSPNSNAEIVFPQLVGMYGHTAWEVCRGDGPVGALGTAPAATSNYSPGGPLQPVRHVARRKATYKNMARAPRHRQPERGISVPYAYAPAREIKTDFSFAIGVANAVAFEVIAFTAILVVWYGLSSLNAAF